MATQQMTRTPSGARPGDQLPPGPGRRARTDEVPLAPALRDAADRRQARASALRDWAREVHPPLSRSLRRRASELELGAVALELRAEGLDGGTTTEEEAHR